MGQRGRGILLALMALMAWPGVASAASGVNISPTESVSFTGRVANIDGVFSSATIDWGDGTSSAGQFDTGATPGVKGTHTYAEEGTYTGTVTYSTDSTSNGKVTFTATVADVGLSATGSDISATTGQSVTGVVSHFTDADPQGTVTDYSAQIDWGDGSHSAGTVSAATGGGFDVTGTHTYQSPGQAAVNVTIADAGGSTAQSSSTATITSPPPPLSASFTWCPVGSVVQTTSATCPAGSPGSELPCQGGPYSSAPFFDASASQGAIVRYRWTYTNVNASGATGTEDESIPVGWGVGSWTSPANWDTLPQGSQVHLLRPATTVTLTVFDSTGRGDLSPPQTITFRDPDELFVVKEGFVAEGITIGNVAWGYYYPYLAPVASPASCFVVQKTSKVGAAVLAARAVWGSNQMTTTVSCPGGSLSCGGTLYAVQPGLLKRRSARAAAGIARRRRRTGAYLGRTDFLIPAGTQLNVRIPLTKQGRRLIRARHLKRVALLLITPSGKSKTLTVQLKRSTH